MSKESSEGQGGANHGDTDTGMLGIGGDSGTGKSTLVGGLYMLFGAEQITSINLDDYRTFDRAHQR